MAPHDLAQHSCTQLCTKRNLARVCARMNHFTRWKLPASAQQRGGFGVTFCIGTSVSLVHTSHRSTPRKRAFPRPPRSRARAFEWASLSRVVSDSIVKSGNQRILHRCSTWGLRTASTCALGDLTWTSRAYRCSTCALHCLVMSTRFKQGSLPQEVALLALKLDARSAAARLGAAGQTVLNVRLTHCLDVLWVHAVATRGALVRDVSTKVDVAQTKLSYTNIHICKPHSR